MNYGPLVFLAAFFALASSWCGFVLTPQLQIGRLQQTNTVSGAAVAYPVSRPGLARQGLEVYRANGCAYCHSQQVGQSGTAVEIALTEAGTNRAATIAALLSLAQATNDESAVWTALPKLGERRPYLDFVLLTALNTRGKDIPAAWLQPLLDSSDFMVRQTAAMLAARQGEQEALGLLFKALKQADWAACSILSISLQEMLGGVLGAPPTDAKNAKALKTWRTQAFQWWQQNGGQLQYVRDAQTGQARWRVK